MSGKSKYLAEYLGLRLTIVVLALVLSWFIGLKPLLREIRRNNQYKADLFLWHAKNQGMNSEKDASISPTALFHISKALQNSDIIPLLIDEMDGKDSSQTLLHVQLTGPFLPLWEFINQMENNSIQISSVDFRIKKDKLLKTERLVVDLIINENQ